MHAVQAASRGTFSSLSAVCHRERSVPHGSSGVDYLSSWSGMLISQKHRCWPCAGIVEHILPVLVADGRSTGCVDGLSQLRATSNLYVSDLVRTNAVKIVYRAVCTQFFLEVPVK